MPISHSDILAWRDVTGSRPERWELQALFDLDSAYLMSLPRPKPAKTA